MSKSCVSLGIYSLRPDHELYLVRTRFVRPLHGHAAGPGQVRLGTSYCIDRYVGSSEGALEVLQNGIVGN